MSQTPDRRPGALEEDDEIRLSTNAVGPTLPGAFNYTGTDFVMRDSAGNFNPRSGAASVDYAWRRHFLLMGG